MNLRDALDDEITVFQGYLAMVKFIEAQLEREGHKSDQIATMLKRLAPGDRFPDTGAICPANLVDWVDATKEVRKS